jgi:glycosyltransferase involved in cell wall biosynthesis
MTHPLFSVIIPTRQRHDTLVYAMKSILEQPFNNLELIIMDNFSSPETAEVVASFNDSRVRYYRSPERLSMSENWELGLSHATGEYVTILGDDDAFISGSFDLCEKLLGMYDFKIISWNTGRYNWPTYILPSERDRLYLFLDHAVAIRDSKILLENVYKGAFYVLLPMLYNSFVHKSIINQVRSRFGRYFLSYCPDVYSGIVNAYFCDQYFYSLRPFALAGASHHSTGASFMNRGLAEEVVENFSKEVKEDDFKKTHEQLTPSNSFEVALGNVFLQTKDAFFPEDSRFKLDFLNLVQAMAANINTNPSFYDDTLREISVLAAKHNIPLSDLSIPEKVVYRETPTAQQGIYRADSGGISIAVNCKQAGITNVFQASKLAQAMLPSNDIFLAYCEQVIQLDESKNIEKDLNLQEINLIIFPNLKESLEQIYFEVSSIIKAVITHPLSRYITLLLCFSDGDDSQLADELVSEITMELLLDEDLQVNDQIEPTISLMEGLSESEWHRVLPRICGRLPLTNENLELINQIEFYSQRVGLPNIKILDNLTSLSRDIVT